MTALKSKDRKFSLAKRIQSFRYAVAGLPILLKSEHNAWIHSIAAIIAIGGGFFFNINRTEWMIIVLCIAAVFVTELVNSAIERLADLISEEYSEKIRDIKDMAAAAVLLAAIASFICGVVIFFPYLIEIL